MSTPGTIFSYLLCDNTKNRCSQTVFLDARLLRKWIIRRECIDTIIFQQSRDGRYSFAYLRIKTQYCSGHNGKYYSRPHWKMQGFTEARKVPDGTSIVHSRTRSRRNMFPCVVESIVVCSLSILSFTISALKRRNKISELTARYHLKRRTTGFEK